MNILIWWLMDFPPHQIISDIFMTKRQFHKTHSTVTYQYFEHVFISWIPRHFNIFTRTNQSTVCRFSLWLHFLITTVFKDSHVIITCGFDWVGIWSEFTESLANDIINNDVMSYSQKRRQIETVFADSIILWITV